MEAGILVLRIDLVLETQDQHVTDHGAVPGQSCPLTIDVDDFYIADTTSTINNTFLGDVRVELHRQSGS